MDEIRTWKTVLLCVLLAVVCLAAAWLATCRIADPSLYEEVVTPVRLLYHGGQAQVKRFSEDYADWLTKEEESRLVSRGEQLQKIEDAKQKVREEVEAARRRRLERRLLKQMVRDQKALFLALDEIQFATDPLLQNEDPNSGLTEFIIRDGQEYLSGGNFELPYYNQGDEAWAAGLFGVDPIRGYGCGPTALAMLVSGMTGETWDPLSFSAWAAGEGYSAPGGGSYLSIVRGTAARFGLDCVSLSITDPSELIGGLENGGVGVALMGPGHFTARGHFILLRGLTEEGQILVADPNSRENSLTAWDPAVILSELSASRSDGSPLWLLSVPDADAAPDGGDAALWEDAV